MSERSEATTTLAVGALVGRIVRDTHGRSIGRIEELGAEIEMHAHGNDYVVTTVAVGRLGPLDAVVSGQFLPRPVQWWRRWTGYRRYELAWDQLDVSDPLRPRLRAPLSASP